MKKIIAIAIAAALVVVVVPSFALAQGGWFGRGACAAGQGMFPALTVVEEGESSDWLGRGNFARFVDEDGDGICDNYGDRGMRGAGGYAYVDEDQDGLCDNYGKCGMRGAGGYAYVDEDGDGICDNYANGGAALGGGYGYVDEDGDGVCDNRADRDDRPRGKGCGRGAAGVR